MLVSLSMLLFVSRSGAPNSYFESVKQLSRYVTLRQTPWSDLGALLFKIELSVYL